VRSLKCVTAFVTNRLFTGDRIQSTLEADLLGKRRVLGAFELPLGIAPLRLVMLAATVSAYSIVFVLSYPAVGSVIASLSVLPVIAVGWWFGLRAGIAAGIAAIALNAGLHGIVGEPWWTGLSAKGATGSIVGVVVGALVGHVQGTRVALARELRCQSCR
jgi:hypothetical protein